MKAQTEVTEGPKPVQGVPDPSTATPLVYSHLKLTWRPMKGWGLLKVNGENRTYVTRRRKIPLPTSGDKKLNLLQNKNLTNIFIRETVQGKDAISLCENKSVKEVITLHEVIPMLLQGKDDSAWYPPLWPLPEI